MRWTPSTTTLAPISWAAAVIAVMSGIVPIAFEAPVTATHRVRSLNNAATAAASSRPVVVSKSAIRTVAPESAAISNHGEMFES